MMDQLGMTIDCNTARHLAITGVLRGKMAPPSRDTSRYPRFSAVLPGFSKAWNSSEETRESKHRVAIHTKVNALLKQYADHVIHYCAADKKHHYYFGEASLTQQGLVSYKILNRVALAMGNPCGNVPTVDLLRGWLEQVKAKRLMPAIYLADPNTAAAAKQLGLKVLPLGMEAYVNLETFSLKGKKGDGLRNAYNKILKGVWSIRDYRPEDWPQVNELNKRWLKQHGNKEIGLGLGRPSPEYLQGTRTRVLFDQDQNLLGYVNSLDLPNLSGGGRSCDILRRHPSPPEGMAGANRVIGALLVDEFLEAQKQGLKYYDLGFSLFAPVPGKHLSDNPALEKLMNHVFNQMSESIGYNVKGLYNAKESYSPEWQPRYLVYPNLLALPSVLMALFRAGEAHKLVPWDKLFNLLVTTVDQFRTESPPSKVST